MLTVFSLVITACTPNRESATTGNLVVATDESFMPIMEAEQEAFMNTYKNMKVELASTSEGRAISLFLGDSVKLIIISRELDTLEKATYAKSGIKYRSIPLANDAVAIISHPDNPDTAMTIEQLRRIFNGEIQTWKQLDSNLGLKDSLSIVFDKGNSSNLSFLQRKLGVSSKNVKIFAAKSNAGVIEYVSTHKNALGIVGLSWVSDSDSPLAVKLRESVQLTWLAESDTAEYFLPYQSDLATGKYPLIRKAICISRDPGVGPATGFMNYMAGDVGQRIILKMGILPHHMPSRVLEIR
ncbi:MAG: substrate-binding domain-containing protein [Verrucomicrobia bacterium]|nr:substrate-binding domain-containing protein [Cytophagales bacterium]